MIHDQLHVDLLHHLSHLLEVLHSKIYLRSVEVSLLTKKSHHHHRGQKPAMVGMCLQAIVMINIIVMIIIHIAVDLPTL